MMLLSYVLPYREFQRPVILLYKATKLKGNASMTLIIIEYFINYVPVKDFGIIRNGKPLSLTLRKFGMQELKYLSQIKNINRRTN